MIALFIARKCVLRWAKWSIGLLFKKVIVNYLESSKKIKWVSCSIRKSELQGERYFFREIVLWYLSLIFKWRFFSVENVHTMSIWDLSRDDISKGNFYCLQLHLLFFEKIFFFEIQLTRSDSNYTNMIYMKIAGLYIRLQLRVSSIIACLSICLFTHCMASFFPMEWHRI